MDAHTASRRARWTAVEPTVAARLLWVVATSLLGFLAIAALVICARRAAGALTEPLPAPVMCALAAALAAAALGFRRVAADWVLRDNVFLGNRIARYVLWAVPSVVLALWAVGLSSRETSTGGLIGLLGLLLVEEGFSWGRFVRITGPRVGVAPESGKESPGRAGGYTRYSSSVASDDAEELDEVDVARDEAVSQRLVRRQGELGESIDGWVRVEFAPGQRQALAHVAICPPLARVPRCDAEPADGPPAQVRVAQALPYGVRLEVKLDKAATKASRVLVEFSISEEMGS